MMDYGLIGNGVISALISGAGSLDWFCAPHPDSEPLFGKILDPEGGEWSVQLLGVGGEALSNIQSRQTYIENTNLLVTELTDLSQNSCRITDFCPKFEAGASPDGLRRVYRKIEPLSGSPIIRILFKPIQGWSKKPATLKAEGGALRFQTSNSQDWFLSTSSPLSPQSS
jgi:GH15 family glucan-1,4-alpha-glucosidase